MVKVRINGYEAPLTLWHIVELEDGVCNASPGIEQDVNGTTDNHQGNANYKENAFSDEWDPVADQMSNQQ